MKTSAMWMLFATMLLGVMQLASVSNANQSATPTVADTPPYHPQPPTEALPETLNPTLFQSDHTAYVSYALAARTKSILYQIPCYCPCARMEGHQSLLDCFVRRHGVRCALCQKEVIFCYRESRKGRTAWQIRQEIADGKAWRMNLDREIKHLYAQTFQFPSPRGAH